MGSLRRSFPQPSAFARLIQSRKSPVPPKPPKFVRKHGDSGNKCCLIGEIRSPVRFFTRKERHDFGVYTFLEIKEPFANHTMKSSPLQILISMRGELAEVSLEYLKPKQFVYVFGHLSSYNKVNMTSGARDIFYKVEVCELNYIRMNNNRNEVQCENKENEWTHKPFSETSNANSGSHDVNYEERNKERLILWQIFFKNPREWKDCRENKPTANYPDFKNMNSREALWVRHTDPPWVRKQLELYDSNVSGTKYFSSNDDRGLCGSKMSDFF